MTPVTCRDSIGNLGSCNFIYVTHPVDSRRGVDTSIEMQDAYFDSLRDTNSDGRFDVPRVAASSSTTPAPEFVNYIWSPLFTNWDAYAAVAAEPASQPVSEASVEPAKPKVEVRDVQLQIVEAPGEWSTIEGARPWLGDRWCLDYPDVYVEKEQSDPRKRYIACGPSLYVYQLKRTGWKAYVLE